MLRNQLIRSAICLMLSVFAVGELPATGISPVNPAFLRWQKTHRLNRIVRPSVTNEQKKVRKLLAAPAQPVQMEDSGLIPTVFNAAYLGNINRPRMRGVGTVYPAKYDLREEGFVSPVRNQSPYGTCWAHATYGSLESFLMKSEGLALDFSENNLANLHGGDWDFDIGGNADLASAYLLRWSGPALESEDAYPNIGGSRALSPFRHVQNVRWILPKKVYLDNDGIKDALMKYGALYVSYYHDAGWYNASTASYYLGVVQKDVDDTRANNHAVTLVGWDDNYPRSNFKIPPPANGAYIVKNSMGSNWGKDGYFYVSYYDESFAWNRLYAFSNAEPVSNFDAVYQYDTLGLVSSFGWGQYPTWGAALFTATNSSPISAIGFYALVPETSYLIQVYTGCSSDNPTSGSKALEQEGTTDVAGYVTVPLYSPVNLNRGQKFSVALRLTTPGCRMPLACECAVVGYSSAATASAGQTFASLDGSTWRDFTTLNGTASFCCKAYTRPFVAVGKTLTAVRIDGADSVRSGKSAKFTCQAQYSDGTVKDVTEQARWGIIEGGTWAMVDDVGRVQAQEIRDRQLVRLYAEYTDGGISQRDVWAFYVTYAAPLAPVNLMATLGDETSCVRLSWDAVDDATAYAIYRSETPQVENAEWLGEAGSAVYDDTSAVPGVDYYYFVKAKNSSGASPYSSGVCGWRALSAPENLVAANGSSLEYVELTWYEASGASYYQIYRAGDLNDEPQAISPWQTSLSFRDRTAEAGKTYLYYVASAVTADGERASALSLFDDGFRAVPVYLSSVVIEGAASIASGDSSTYICKAVYTDGSIKLPESAESSWQITAGGKFAQVSEQGTVTTAPVASNEPMMLQVTYSDNGVVKTADKAIMIQASKPSKPQTVTATAVSAEKGISISWSVLASSSPPLSYHIYRMATDGERMLLATVGSDATTYTDSTAMPGVTYTYQVSAENGAGESPLSDASATETVPLAAPMGVVASGGEYLDKVVVTWKPVSGAACYRVARGNSQAAANLTELGEWQADTSFADTTGAEGVTYWYFVKAAPDASGKNASAYSVGDGGWRKKAPKLGGLSVLGPSKMAPGATAVLSCTALYGDGTKAVVTPEWTVSGPAAIGADGKLTAQSVSSRSIVTVTATYREGSVVQTATTTVTLVVPVKAKAEVKNVVVSPRWPFNGLLDIDYEVLASPEGTRAVVSLSGFDNDHNMSLAAHTLTGDGAAGAVLPGRHRLVWNVAADYPRLHTTSFGVEMSVVPVPVLIPTNVTASTGTSSDQVTISWSEIDEAVSYEVYRGLTDSTNEAARIGTAYGLSYADTEAMPGTTYHYWVRSVSAEGASEFGSSVIGWRGYADVGVTFHPNGGTTEASSQAYEPQRTFGTLPDATRLGYAFLGWYTEKEGGTEVTAASIVPTISVTLFAHWKAHTYAIRFNANGGSGNMGDLPMTYDIGRELPSCGFSRSGYAFAGWARSEIASVSYVNGETVVNLTTVNGTTVVLYAVWYPIVPEVPQGVTASRRTMTDGIEVKWSAVEGATEYRIYRHTADDRSAVSEPIGTTGELMWLDSTCEVGRNYYYWVKAFRSDNGQLGGFSATATGRRAYPPVSCEFNGNGGTSMNKSKLYTPESPYGELPSAYREGYEFIAWYTAPVGGIEIDVTTEVPTTGHELFAHWKANSYAVRFAANGGDGAMSDQPMTYGVEAKLSVNRYVRSAYTFGGWARSPDGEKAFVDGATVGNLTTENNAVVKLYALWSPILPAVPKNVRASNRTSEDGILVSWSAVAEASSYVIYRDTESTSEDPEPVGMASETSFFDTNCVAGTTYYYWVKSYREDNGTECATLSSPAAEGRRKYSDQTVVFDGNGGEPEKPSQKVTPEFAYGELPSVSRTGYLFMGWYTAATGGNAVDPSTVVLTSVTTLFAQWDPVQYTISFDANGGEGEMDKLPMVYDVEKNLPENNFARAYYTFAGWTTAAEGSVTHADGEKVKNLSAQSGAVVTLFAVWSPFVPGAPTDVQAGMGLSTTEIVITWTASASATVYEIWRGETSNSEEATKIGTSSSANYHDATAEPGKVYYYWIKAGNPVATGCLSAYVQGALKPLPPGKIDATWNTYDDRIVISWSEVVGATRYDVYRNDQNDSETAKLIGQTTETSFTDADVQLGVTRYYWVKACNGSIGVASDFGVCAEGSAQKKLLSISIAGASELDAGGEATYTATLFYSDGTSQTRQPSWAISDGGDVAAIDRFGKLSVSSSLVDRVVVVFASYEDNGHAEATKTVTIHKVIPLSVALDNESLSFETEGDVAWQWVEEAEDDAPFVNVYAARSGVVGNGQSSQLKTVVEGPCTLSFRWKVSSETGDTLTFAIDGNAKDQISGTSMTDFVEKSYTIEQSGDHTLTWTYAKNSSGVGGSDCGWVDEVKYERIYAPPAPTNVEASNGTSTEEIIVTWMSVPGADGYQVWRGIGSDPADATLLAVAPAMTYVDTSAEPGVAYTYWIAATNLGGESDFSASATGVRQLSAPTGLKSTAETSGAKLEWDAVEGATEYLIYRSDDNDVATATQIATTQGNSYIDKLDRAGEKAGKDYYYWVVVCVVSNRSGFGESVCGYKKLSISLVVNGAYTNSGVGYIAKSSGAKSITIYKNGTDMKQDWFWYQAGSGYAQYYAVAIGDNGSKVTSSTVVINY